MNEILGLIVCSLGGMFLTYVLATRPRVFFLRSVLLGAGLMRVFGSTLRYEMLMGYYNRVGDALLYYGTGLLFAERWWALDLDMLSYEQWFGRGQSVSGTLFVKNISGLVLAGIGESLRGEFVVFSFFSFLGLVLILWSVVPLYNRAAIRRLALLMFFFPSLWYWPCSVGKEAILSLALGLTFYGFVGRGNKIRWGVFLLGLALAYGVRPHVAGILSISAAAAQWLNLGGKSGARAVLYGIVFLGLAIGVLSMMSARFGLRSGELEDLQDFAAQRAMLTSQGGSKIGSGGGASPPEAFMNVWMRPFPWEAHNAAALGSALETLLLWYILITRRHDLIAGLKSWSKDRILGFCVFLLASYTLMIGLTIFNLGIIARQRTPVFPFLFMLFTLLPSHRLPASTAPPPARRLA